jgi:hypothetical protein
MKSFPYKIPSSVEWQKVSLWVSTLPVARVTPRCQEWFRGDWNDFSVSGAGTTPRFCVLLAAIHWENRTLFSPLLIKNSPGEKLGAFGGGGGVGCLMNKFAGGNVMGASPFVSTWCQYQYVLKGTTQRDYLTSKFSWIGSTWAPFFCIRKLFEFGLTLKEILMIFLCCR